MLVAPIKGRMDNLKTAFFVTSCTCAALKQSEFICGRTVLHIVVVNSLN